MNADEKPDFIPILRGFLDHESPHIRSRAQIILMTLEGRSVEEIAAETELSERTVQKWVKAWEAEGLAIFPDGPTEMDEETGKDPDVSKEIPITHEALVEDPVPEIPTDDSPTLILPKPVLPQLTAPGILPTDSLAEAARKALYFQFQQVLIHYGEIDGHDPVEGVHKMRVAIRRIRSGYRLFDGNLTRDYYGKLPKRLRYTAQMLGHVRDLDVARIKTETYILDTLKGDAASLMPLLNLLDERRTIALQEAEAWFNDKRFAKFMARLARAVELPIIDSEATALPSAAYQVKHVLPRLIYTQWEAVARFDTVIDHADTETLHELRIEFKRLRYTLEFFEEVLGPSIKFVIKEIKLMQDHLGDINDAEVAEVLLRDMQKDLKKASRQAVESYRAAREEEATLLKAGTAAAWVNYNRSEVHEALAQAIGVL